MSELVQYGGSLGIIIVAVILLVKAFIFLLHKDVNKEEENHNWTIQRDIEKNLVDIKLSMSNQTNAQDRIADSLESIARDISSMKMDIENLPINIATAIKHKNNGMR